jgi:hypothetical protein
MDPIRSIHAQGTVPQNFLHSWSVNDTSVFLIRNGNNLEYDITCKGKFISKNNCVLTVNVRN